MIYDAKVMKENGIANDGCLNCGKGRKDVHNIPRNLIFRGAAERQFVYAGGTKCYPQSGNEQRKILLLIEKTTKYYAENHNVMPSRT